MAATSKEKAANASNPGDDALTSNHSICKIFRIQRITDCKESNILEKPNGANIIPTTKNLHKKNEKMLILATSVYFIEYLTIITIYFRSSDVGLAVFPKQ